MATAFLKKEPLYGRVSVTSSAKASVFEVIFSWLRDVINKRKTGKSGNFSQVVCYAMFCLFFKNCQKRWGRCFTSFFVQVFHVSSPLRETKNLSQISKDLLEFSIHLKLFPKTSLICIVSTMFQFFSNIVKNIEVDFFFKTSPKNCIFKNVETRHR